MYDLLDSLIGLFHPARDEIGEFTPISSEDLPPHYRSLLAHQDHMTVTVEAWHNSLVDLQVLDEMQEEGTYSRQILLFRQRDGSPVQFGIMRITLEGLPEIVRMEIESRALPLGRILIRHHLLREVELCQLWEVNPSSQIRSLLKCGVDDPIYGRTARILVYGKPAVELLEVVVS